MNLLFMCVANSARSQLPEEFVSNLDFVITICAEEVSMS